MSQSSTLSKSIYFDDAAEFINFIRDSRNIIKDVHIIYDRLVRVLYVPEETFIEIPKYTNTAVAGMITSYARMHLYSLMECLQEKCLYVDTDSCIFIDKERPKGSHIEFENENITMGSAMGSLTDELQDDGGLDDYITEFVSGGPKNYGYITNNGIHKMIVKGINVKKFSNAISFQILKDMVLRQGEDIVKVTEPFAMRMDANRGTIHTVPLTKEYRMVYSKRILLEDEAGNCVKTLPYGWVA